MISQSNIWASRVHQCLCNNDIDFKSPWKLINFTLFKECIKHYSVRHSTFQYKVFNLIVTCIIYLDYAVNILVTNNQMTAMQYSLQCFRHRNHACYQKISLFGHQMFFFVIVFNIPAELMLPNIWAVQIKICEQATDYNESVCT